MKKFLIAGTVFLAFIFLLFNEMYTFTNGSPAARSGGAGELTCATSSCHIGSANTGPGMITLTSDAVNNEYVPGNTYTITATVEQSGITKFGFEILAGYSATQDASTGTIQLINTTNTQQKANGARRYVTHRSPGTSGSDTKSWSFEWVAPGSNTGDVTFFGCGNATNGGGNRTGDNIYTSSLTLTEGLTSVAPIVREAPQMQVFPTYTNDMVTLQLESPTTEALTIRVVNLQGQVMYMQAPTAHAGKFEHTVAVDGWEAGLYYLQVSGEGFAQTTKILKY